MSKSDQFAVPAEAPVSVPKAKPSPLRLAGVGCGAIAIILVTVGLVLVGVASSGRNKSASKEDTVRSLAGVPVYPGASYDEELTRDKNGALAVTSLFSNYKFKALGGFRTPDAPEKVLPFYDERMAFFALAKTTLGGNMSQGAGYIGGASYTSPNTKVIIQMYHENGEDNQLIIYRFDQDSKQVLTQPSDTVTPEDFKKAKAEAEKKRKQQQVPKK